MGRMSNFKGKPTDLNCWFCHKSLDINSSEEIPESHQPWQVGDEVICGNCRFKVNYLRGKKQKKYKRKK